MLQTHQIEEVITAVTAMDRETLIDQFRDYRGSFPVDFTRDFLQRQSVDRLRHLFVALCLQQQRIPQIETPEAA